MQWRFWIALCGILLSIGFVIGLTAALFYLRDSAAITISAFIALGASVASAVISGVGLFQAWNRNRREEERIHVLEFDGFFSLEGTTILHPPLTGWIATTYTLRVRRTNKGIGRAEQCDGFISVADLPMGIMRSRWVPDNVIRSDIGGQMDLFLFQIIPIRREIVFSPTSPHEQITLVNLSLEPLLDQLLTVEIHSRNAKTPEPLRVTIRQIMEEARAF
jgi:hypothetical protein